MRFYDSVRAAMTDFDIQSLNTAQGDDSNEIASPLVERGDSAVIECGR